MSLLPKTHTEFQLKDYWDQFFAKRKSAFEWYGEYADLCHILHKYVRPSGQLLVVGCGNSHLSEDLYDAGFHGIENIDISDIVIRQMSAKNRQKRPEMQFTKMDMLEMSFDSGTFDCVIDKGTLDAIYSNIDEATIEKVEKMFSEIERVLKIAGRYICITLAQQHILQSLLQRFEFGWLLRAHKVDLEGLDDTSGGLGTALPVFVFVMTKMARIEGKPLIAVHEYIDDNDKCVRCEGVEGVSEYVKGCQQYAMLTHHLSTVRPDEQVQLQLWSASISPEPRYTLHVIDQAKRKGKNGPFAVFIAPQGREVDWMFCSDSGRSHLAESAGFERLVLVTLHRGHTYAGIEGVKMEVGGRAMELAQSRLSKGKYPVLTLGGGVGSRTVLHEDTSDVSGSFVVEESVGDEGEVVRRLVFLSAPQLAQTETPVVSVKQKAKGKKKNPPSSSSSSLHLMKRHSCFSSLSFAYHRAMLASLALLPHLSRASDWGDSPVANGNGGHVTELQRILLVGLGGGALPTYIHRNIPNIDLDIVELDPKMVEVAKKWFGFDSGEKARVHIEDGVKFITEAATKVGKKGSYCAVLLDVDSKDASAGMTSPPLAFVETECLIAARSLLTEDGIFVTNLAARNKQLKSEVLQRLHTVFPHLLTISIPKNINEVVVGFTSKREYLTASSSSSSLVPSPGLRERVDTLVQLIVRHPGSEVDARMDLQSDLMEYFKTAHIVFT